MKRWLAQVFDEPGDLRAMALLRALVGPIVLLHLRPMLRAMAHDVYYGDHFYAPYVSWFPEAPRLVYYALLCGCAVAAVMMTCGIWRRGATIYALAFVAYNLLLSRTHFHHNRHFLLVVLLGLSLLPGRPIRSRAPGPVWPIWLMRFEMASIYFGSGLSKLLDPDWFGGVVTQLRVERGAPIMRGHGLPEWFIDVVSSESFHVVGAKAIIFTELFLCVALWIPRTRLAAIWIAASFHIGIEIFASVQIFSYLCLASLLLWVTPRQGGHPVVVRAGSWQQWCTRWLDWLGRFDVRVDDAAPATPGLDILVRCPATFYPTYPVYAVARVLRRRGADGTDSRS